MTARATTATERRPPSPSAVRDQVDLAELEADIAGTVGAALRPTIVRPLDPTWAGDDKVNVAATALVGTQFALGCAVAAVAASGLLRSEKPGAVSLLILLVAYVPYAGVGSILVSRRPRNVIGWVLLAIGWTFAVSFLPLDATVHELQTLTAPPHPGGHRLAHRNERVAHLRPDRDTRLHVSDR